VKGNKRERARVLPYVGWKIFAYGYSLDPTPHSRVSKRYLFDNVRECFRDDHWVVENLDGGLKLGHVESDDEVKVKIEPTSFTIDYDDGTRTEIYLLVLESECLAWKKQTEFKHKKLMEQVSRRLPSWWEKVDCYVEDGKQLTLVFSSNIDQQQPAFPVTSQTLPDLQIPDDLPPRPKFIRSRVVKGPPKKPKQPAKGNALKDLMEQVKKEKRPRSNRNGR
jgi:hypothetical protein